MRKLLTVLLVTAVIATMLFPGIAAGLEPAAELLAEPNLLIGNDAAPIVLPTVGSNFGPYHASDPSQLHAYDPFGQQASQQNAVDGEYASDTVLLKLKQLSGGYGAQSVPFVEMGVVQLEPLFFADASSFSVQETAGTDAAGSWYKARLVAGSSVPETVNALSQDARVLLAQPDYLRRPQVDGLPDMGTDERLVDQWYLDRLGIRESWKKLTQDGQQPGGSRDVVVAVIDTGVDYNHPDLAGNMWVNTGEIPNNGQDDDRNGYIDDIHGACTVGDRYSGESGDPLDDHGHGTHVAGIIAALSYNGGMAGVAFNVQIMAIKAGQSSGVFSASDIAQAVQYATAHGADVINMSFGGYGRSVAEEDALAFAFGSSVLVAAAGNDGVHNDPYIRPPLGKPMYPAAYNWVLGVMAERQASDGDHLADFSNWDINGQDTLEYELMAPGTEILSTLPNGQYAKWSGTSMAAPIVSGIAALVRTQFSDKNVYSSRFIMGQLASSGPLLQGITYDQKQPPKFYHEVSAIAALTSVPQPEVSYLEHYLFDTPDVAAGNDGDGVLDAGETIDMAMVLRNHWGKADNVTVTLDTNSPAGLADPYAVLLSETVNYGAIGTFNIDDNGLVYDSAGVVTGVTAPFRLYVPSNTPNDHLISLNVTITAANGYDPEDSTVYTTKASFSLIVRRGRELPRIIGQDMTLTKADYWLVPDKTLIEQGVTVTIEPGTQVQFWSADPSDPYAEQQMPYLQVEGRLNAQGTATEPVELFAGMFYPGFQVMITQGGEVSQVSLAYTRVMNPVVNVTEVDHCYFSQDLFGPVYYRYKSGDEYRVSYRNPSVSAQKIRFSRFDNLGFKIYGSNLPLEVNSDSISHSLFNSCDYRLTGFRMDNNVYLKNYRLYQSQWGSREYWVSSADNFGYAVDHQRALLSVFPVRYNETGSTYLTVRANSGMNARHEFDLVQLYAEHLGGHIVTIEDARENELVRSYAYTHLQNRELFETLYPSLDWHDFSHSTLSIGLTGRQAEGDYRWVDGSPFSYANWYPGQPDEDPQTGLVMINSIDGYWFDEPYSYSGIYVVEIPGPVLATGLSLSKSELTLGAGGAPGQLQAFFSPANTTDQSARWTSSDPAVATVDEHGLVTPLAVGETEVTATSVDGGFTALCSVQVIEVVPVQAIAVDRVQLELPVNTTHQLQVSLTPDHATDQRIAWSSSDPAVATVSEQGLVTALRAGEATITVVALDGEWVAQCAVKAIVPSIGVVLNQAFLRLLPGGETATLQAIVQPEAATYQQVTWRSSNSAVIDVSPGGVITPVGVGTAQAIATTLDGGFSASCTVSVWPDEAVFAATQVSAGYSHSMALNCDGTAYAWGDNSRGQLGDGTRVTRYSPTTITAANNELAQLQAGREHGLLLGLDGNVHILGDSYYLGSGVAGLGRVSALSSNADWSEFALALKEDGSVWAWGENIYGQLGDGTKTNRGTPIQVEGLTEVISVATGTLHSLALKADGIVWAWGHNGAGQLGTGDSTERTLPAPVAGLDHVIDIAAGASHSLALRDDGTVWVWGSIAGNRPTQVAGLADVTSVSAGYDYSLALTEAGTVYAWGRNNFGQLGRGMSNDYLWTPQPVTGLSSIAAIDAGYEHALALKEDGTVWAWGHNSDGRLGDGTTVTRHAPVQTLFGILPDNTPPLGLQTELTGSGELARRQITVTFSEDVQPGADYGLITVKSSSGNSLSLQRKAISGNQLVIDLILPLAEGSSCTLNLPAAALVDRFNNALPAQCFSISVPEATQQAVAQLITDQGFSAQAVPSDYQPFTQSDVDAARLALLESGQLSTITDNAFLNVWWDPNVEHWLRFTAAEGRAYRQYLSGNFWGVANNGLIDQAIVDYHDDFNKATVVYQPVLDSAPETAYPFVADLYLSTATETRATRVGAERITVHVLFNRDMDQSIPPQVSFGPDVPETDYTVHAVDGGWLGPRHWQGEFDVNPITGDGYQFFRVAGAVAADDPWLVTGDDSERFRFEIVTSGTEAMNLQAVGAEGRIELSWTQDDFDLLAGYNLYRADAVDGQYAKINQTVIPGGQRSFEDSNVDPGRNYFYTFTVVKTDLSESDCSNVAAAAALDTVKPVINHLPLQSASPGLPLQISADVSDNVRVAKVELHYRRTGEVAYTTREMQTASGTRYTASVPGSAVLTPGLEYYIVASDSVSAERSGSAAAPHRILVSDQPQITSVSPASGPATGGTAVTITGSNFKDGASVTFGGAVAASCSVVSQNRLDVVSPAHSPATVDIRVTNPDGSSSQKLRAFTYEHAGAALSLPEVSGNVGDTFEVALSLSGAAGLTAADISLEYDPDLLQLLSVSKGSLASGFSLQSSIGSGSVLLALASATPITGSGELVKLEFQVLASSKVTSALAIMSALLNGGAMQPELTDGSFSLADTHTLRGYVQSSSQGQAVSEAELVLTGSRSYSTTSQADGSYSINGIVDGDYLLSISKQDQVGDSISAYDASLILQHMVGNTILSVDQLLAADVDRSGSVNSMDAAYVLQQAAGLLSLPFPGAGEVWTFSPGQVDLSAFSDDRYQSFTATLLGDVSGNWSSLSALGEEELSPTFALGTVRTEPKKPVNIPLYYDTHGRDLYSADLVIEFDPSVVESVNVSITDQSADFALAQNASQPGRLVICLASGTPLRGEGQLLNLSVQPTEMASQPASLSFVRADVNESATLQFLNGKLIVAIPGDVDANGGVNVADLALAALNYGAHAAEIDLNGDGLVDLFDLVLVSRNLDRD